MKRLFTLGLFSLLMMLSISASSQSLYYDFKDTLGERDGNGPSLNQLGTGSFVSDTLNELSCLPRRVYTFGNNDGLQFDNSAAGTFLGETYSIEMYFKWLDNGGFKRIIDFKNRTEDFGLYATTSVLSFYDGLDVNTNQFVANQYVYLCITRDSASQLVSMYVDGVLVGDFTDINERGVIDTSQVLNFFRDDLIFGGEARPGNIAFLKLHNFELTANQVDDSYNSIKDTMHILTFTQDITSACLTGNLVNFTNTSENDSSQVSYLWDFGDGNSAAGTNASYSYSAGGVFTVALIGSASGGCTDTAFSSVEIFALPAIDLGADVSACQGDQVVLDAGGSFATYQWSTAATSQTITVGTSGTYYATVTDNNGCVNSDSVTVVFNALPVVTLPGDSTICDGQTLTLSGPPSMSSYNWSTGETTQDIVVSVSGVYAVAVVDLNGCGASDTVTINVNALPVVSLGADTSICDGISVTLDAGAGFSAYLWSDNSTGQTLDVTVSGTYSVTVTDGFGCQGTDAVDVIVNPAPIVDLGVDFTMCGGTLTTLDAGAGQTAYLWNDGSQNQTLDIITGGTFSVTVTDANGCTSSDVVTITVNPALNLGPDVVVCDGQAVTLDAGAGLSAYVWNTGEVTQTILVSASGVYGVAITDINGCINSDSLTVTFSTAPVVDLGPDVTACNGTVVSLDAGSGFTNYTWNDGSSLQTLDVSTSGTYYVTVSNIDGCTATDSVTVTILAPVVVTLGNDTTVCDGELVTLDAGAGYTAYLWNDGSSAQTLTASSAGTYEVTVTDANGCTASDVVVINFFAPVPVPTVTQINSNTIESSPAAGYQWYQVPGGPIVGATSQTYSPPQNGTFYVVVTDANGCQSEPSADFDFINTGISDITSGWSVYPNPADQTLFITITGISGAAVQAEIIDLAGRTVLAQQFGAGDKGEMDISSLTPGTYMVRLMHQGAFLVKPVVVR